MRVRRVQNYGPRSKTERAVVEQARKALNITALRWEVVFDRTTPSGWLNKMPGVLEDRKRIIRFVFGILGTYSATAHTLGVNRAAVRKAIKDQEEGPEGRPPGPARPVRPGRGPAR